MYISTGMFPELKQSNNLFQILQVNCLQESFYYSLIKIDNNNNDNDDNNGDNNDNDNNNLFSLFFR